MHLQIADSRGHFFDATASLGVIIINRPAGNLRSQPSSLVTPPMRRQVHDMPYLS